MPKQNLIVCLKNSNVHYEFFETGQTVTTNLYCELLSLTKLGNCCYSININCISSNEIYKQYILY